MPLLADFEASIDFYLEVLGFIQDFHFSPYAGVPFGDCCLHLCAQTILEAPIGGGALGVYTDEVDRHWRTIVARGANVLNAPVDQPYGMRDFVISDPDGNVITFGCPTKNTAVSKLHPTEVSFERF